MFHLLELSGPGDLPFSLGDDFTCLQPRRKWFRLPSDFFSSFKIMVQWSPGGDAGFECNERSYENVRNLRAETRHRHTKH